MTMNIEESNERYLAACHAMQTGVKYDMIQESGDDSRIHKHLRVGANSAMVSQAAIASLLIQKGVFTLEEYMESQALEMEKEVESYEKRLGFGLG